VTVILAIANHNRGAGKTVTAANVSAGFAHADPAAAVHPTRVAGWTPSPPPRG
jgi:cellulose biosynthesis protein BcsQ